MAELAQKAVFASSTDGKVFCDGNKSVEGPSQEDMQSISGVLRHYATLGFQASHFAQAIEICSKMLQPQPPSMGFQPQSCEDASAPTVLVQPTIFLGATANLFGTGCRDAICFLCKECVPLQDGVEPAVPPEETMTSSPSHDNKDFIPSPSFSSKALIHALVVSGGAMEHDIRRACEEYRIADYESAGGVVSTLNGRQTTEANRLDCQFGNVRYGRNNCSASSSSLFSGVMRRLVARATKLQQQRKAVCAAQAIPAVYDDVCSWALSPSALWYMVGRWLPDIFAEALLDAGEGEPSAVAEKSMQLSKSTVLYWAAINDVPIFSPSFADGDILHFILEAQSSSPLLQIDLVSDIHQINKLAMRSRRTGMLILGGGVVKHHVCNANLMRNGADSAVFINNGQEFDGSDAGARPDEAVSWGKIRMNADSVKVYAEISLIFPLLVTQVFVPWVRASRRFYEPSEAGVTVAADGLKKEVTVVGHMCVKD